MLNQNTSFMNLYRVIILFSFVLFYCSINAQTFKYPVNANGVKVACEKFEQIEHYLKSIEDNPIKIKSKNLKSKTRSAGEVLVNSAKNELELHAAVNPVDEENIIVGCIKFDEANPLQGLSIGLYSSKDGADTWTRSDFIGILNESDIPFGGGDPIIVFDNDGVAHLTWLLVSLGESTSAWGIYYATSSDGGVNWEIRNPIIETEFTDIFGLSDLEFASDKQWMVSDNEVTSPHNGNVYIAFTNIKDLISNVPRYEITFQRKIAGQDSFNIANTIILNTTNYALGQFTSIDTDREGNIYVTFLADDDDDEDPNQYAIYLAKSTDGGVSFEAEQKVQDFTFAEIGNSASEITGVGGQRLYPCPHIGVDNSGGEYDGRLYMAYTSTLAPGSPDEGYDIYLTTSDDRGDTWSEPRVVNNDDNPLTEQFYSAIDVSKDGFVSLAWYDGRDAIAGSSDINYYLGISKDGGESFEQIKVSSESSDFNQIGSLNQNFGIGEYNQVVSSGDYVIPIWADGRDNNGEISIYAYKQDVNTISSTKDGLVKINGDVFITSISPNPAIDILNIDLILNKTLDLSYEIVDLSGKIIIAKADNRFSSGNHQISVDVSKLTNGNYIFNLISTDTRISRKVTVIK